MATLSDGVTKPMASIKLDNIPFEIRYGERCPFCNKSWGDPSPCGDSRADWTIRDGLSMLFAGSKENNCSICDEPISRNRQFCMPCYDNRQRARNKVSRHKRYDSTCEYCGKITQKRKFKLGGYCGASCSNKARASRKATKESAATQAGAAG